MTGLDFLGLIWNRSEVEQLECDSSHLHEREDEAHGEVGNPVKGTSNDVGRWAVGLFEQLRSYQERDPRWNQTSRLCVCPDPLRPDRTISSGLDG